MEGYTLALRKKCLDRLTRVRLRAGRFLERRFRKDRLQSERMGLDMRELRMSLGLLQLDSRRQWDKWVVVGFRRASPSKSCKLARSSKWVRCLDETSAHTGCTSNLVLRRGNHLLSDMFPSTDRLDC